MTSSDTTPYTPLREAEDRDEERVEENNEYEHVYESQNWYRKFSFSRSKLVLAFVLFGIVAVVVFAWVDGVFRKYPAKDPVVNNDTYVEPYTKTKFKKWLQPEETESSKLFHLIGVGLRTKKVPVVGITVKVYAIGLYVGYTEGRKELRKWNSNRTDSKSSPTFDDELATLLTSGRVPLIFRMVQVGTPPKSHNQYDDWIDRMKPYLREKGETSEKLSHDIDQFKGWFKQGFKRGDDYSFEWEIGKFYDSLHLMYNCKKSDRANGNVAYAFFKQELYQMKNRVINLMSSILR